MLKYIPRLKFGQTFIKPAQNYQRSYYVSPKGQIFSKYGHTVSVRHLDTSRQTEQLHYGKSKKNTFQIFSQPKNKQTIFSKVKSWTIFSLKTANSFLTRGGLRRVACCGGCCCCGLSRLGIFKENIFPFALNKEMFPSR